MSMFCSNCGSSIANDTQICPYCGFNNYTNAGYSTQNTQSYAAQTTQSYPAQQTTQPNYSYQQPATNVYAPPVIVQNGYTESMPMGKYRPLSAWAYFGWTLLYCIPIVGFIALIINSVSDANINRRNHARSYWIALLVAVLIYVIFFLVLGVSLSLNDVSFY